MLLAEGAMGPLGDFLPFILMIGVFYFLVLRPMSKQEKERKQRLSELKRGDRVVLTGGLIGRISRVDEDIVVVEIADKVKVRVLKKDVADFEEAALSQAKKDRGDKGDKGAKAKDDKAKDDKDTKAKDDEKGARANDDDGGDASRKAG
ncbi:Preprotein translocase subunit YajC [Enhygromyxa salina]|uniref:Sec translocon accessory complex subunit YajC n=2 Tax=Enhygromyxa salina TaxID=215803 RepID=A0A0C2D9A0_9BACT|nr:Preprotein translocase subunit YajC [Enhygromyxa salina]